MKILDYDLSKFTRIASASDLEDFFRVTRGLHDSIVKELSWTTEDRVKRDLSLHYGDGDGARIIMQTQHSESPVIELVARTVELLSIRPGWEVNGYGMVEKGKIVVSFSQNYAADNVHHGLICKELYYRIHNIDTLQP